MFLGIVVMGVLINMYFLGRPLGLDVFMKGFLFLLGGRPPVNFIKNIIYTCKNALKDLFKNLANDKLEK